jgi:hypothetical protein
MSDNHLALFENDFLRESGNVNLEDVENLRKSKRLTGKVFLYFFMQTEVVLVGYGILLHYNTLTRPSSCH